MKIVQLTAENVKKLKVVDITPTKDFISITGKNGSGKTSVLDSIWWALAGKEVIQGQPIRQGEEKAIIKLNLGDVVVTRRFTKAGTTLVVENADGFRAASPQAMLDALIGNLTFDPLEFSRMTGKQQFDSLRSIAEVKVDFEALAAADKADYDKRRDINRDINTLEGQVKGIQVADDAPEAEVNVAGLMKQLTEIEDMNSVSQAEELAQENTRRQRDQYVRKVTDLREQLNEAQAQLDVLQAKVTAFIKPTYQSTDDIKAQIAGAEAVNEKVRAKKRKGELNAQIAFKQKASDELSAAIEARAAGRVAAMQEAKMPIVGLTLGEGEVIFNRIPFAQLSAAEQLRVSVAIAMAANPKLKIIRIKDGSLLDDDSLKMIQEMAAEREYQIWCERVDSTGKIGIVMEDGEIVATNGEAA